MGILNSDEDLFRKQSSDVYEEGRSAFFRGAVDGRFGQNPYREEPWVTIWWRGFNGEKHATMNEYERDLAEWRLKRPDQRIFGDMVRCTRCDQMKIKQCFPVSKRGIASWCIACHTDYVRERRAKQRAER